MRKTMLAAAGALVLAAPVTSLACGGFFCSSSPVDQQAERILFVQEDATTVSAYVEIRYSGEPQDFAWVVPVPEAPVLDIFYNQAFQALDQATQPTFQPPFACVPQPAVDFDNAGGGEGVPDRGVNILAEEVVGPFQTVTIAPTDPTDPRPMIEWLRQNEYRLTPEMEPFVAQYAADGLKFVAMKLLPDTAVDAIQPIKMTYKAEGPLIPLRLTSVAAELEMGVKVWVLGDGRFGSDRAITIDDAELRFDPDSFQTNYVPLVARKVDAAEDVAFITEMAGPTAGLAEQIEAGGVPGDDAETQEAFEALLGLLRSKPYVTRLYTRLSPEEMDRDPTFRAVGGGDVDRFHQLPEPTDDSCGSVVTLDADPCAFAACGAGGECYVADEPALAGGGATRALAACACLDGTAARSALDSAVPGGMRTSCGDQRLNFTRPELIKISDVGGVNLVFPDVCAGSPCGDDGVCVSHNGTQSCACERGFVALARQRDDGGLYTTCVSPRDGVREDFYSRVLPEPDLPYPGRRVRSGAVSSGDGCSATGHTPAALSTILLVAAATLLRRRRR